MEKISIAKMENVSGGKFWGSETSCSASSSSFWGECYQYCIDQYYVLWVGFVTDVYTIPCDTE